MIVEKKLSSLDLVNYFLNKIDAVEPEFHSFVSVTNDLAKQQALAIDQNNKKKLDKLTGIPMQIKDVICTKGVPTTCSSKMLENFIPTYNATVYQKLLDKSAVLLGKGNMDEFAMGSSTENSAFHTTKNPWNVDMVPGGSSGGSAAAVSLGEVPFSLGSDTGGSIRQPASFCGVVGLKPTYGLVSRYGLVAFASSFDQIGPITRTVTDSAIVLKAIAGYDSMDATSINQPVPNYEEALGKDIKGIKIGIPKEYFSDAIDINIKNKLMDAIKVFENLGAIIEETSTPTSKYALPCYYIIASSECSTNLARYDGVKYGFSAKNAETIWDLIEETRMLGFGPEVKRRIMLGTYALSSGYYDAYYVKAQKVRTIIIEEFNEIFKQFDVLLTPTTPSVAFPIGTKIKDPIKMYQNDILTIPANMAGIPAISIPCGFVSGLPVGLQLMGKAFDEQTLFKVGFAFEQSNEFWKSNPLK